MSYPMPARSKKFKYLVSTLWSYAAYHKYQIFEFLKDTGIEFESRNYCGRLFELYPRVRNIVSSQFVNSKER